MKQPESPYRRLTLHSPTIYTLTASIAPTFQDAAIYTRALPDAVSVLPSPQRLGGQRSGYTIIIRKTYWRR